MNRLFFLFALAVPPALSQTPAAPPPRNVNQPGAPAPAPAATSTTSSRISRVVSGPDGRAQGLLLRNGTYVNLSPGLSQQIPAGVLRPSLGKNVSDINKLVKLAERELAGSHLKDAADLLRAGEHLSFGYLASSKRDEDVHPKLSGSAEEEFQHKLEKAEEHWEESEALSGVYQKAVDGAQKAFDAGAYRRALELARAAEAIAHVHLHDDEES